MKKIFTLVAAALVGIAAWAEESTERYLDRAIWQITPCSEINEGNGSGYASKMIDDNVNTYWHSSWSSDTANDSYHWFMIDLGVTDQIDGFEYMRRQNSTTGQFCEGKIYVSNTPFEAFNNCTSSRSYYNNADNTPAGSFTFTYTDNADGVRRCTFDTPVFGKYILVILSKTGSGDSNAYACCGDFKLFSTGALPNLANAFEEGISSKKALAETLGLLKSVIGNEAVPTVATPADLTYDNLAEKINLGNATYQTYINKFDNKKATIKCAIRREQGYLAAVPRGNEAVFNTTADLTPDCVWTIFVENEGIKLFNKTTGYWIGTNNGPKTSRGEGQLLIPSVWNESTDGKIKFAKGTTSQFLNVDNGNNNLTNYRELADPGSCWYIAAAPEVDYVQPEVSTAAAPKYYRIVNARQMYNNAAPALCFNGEDRDAVAEGCNTAVAAGSGPGLYWRMEDAGNGAVKLVNLTGFQLKDPGSSGEVTMNADGTPVYVIKQTDAQFGTITCFAISNKATADNTSCMDYNGGTKFVWNPTRDKVGHGANGSLWYFIAADDAEVANATTAYINALSNRCTSSAAGQDKAVCNLLSSSIFDAEKSAALAEQVNDALPANMQGNYTFPTNVADANAFMVTVKNHTYTSPSADAINEVLATAAGKHVLLKSRRVASSGHNHPYLTADYTTTNKRTDLNNNNSVRSIWQLESASNGQFYLRHQASGSYLSNNTTTISGQTWLQPTETAEQAYTLHVSGSQNGFGFTSDGNTGNTGSGIHVAGEPRVCNWLLDNCAESWFDMIAVDGEVEISASNGGTNEIVISFGSDATVNDFGAYTDGYKLKLTKETATNREEAPAIRRSNAPEAGATQAIEHNEISGNELTISGVSEGNYTLEIPAGYFSVNGKYSAPITYSFGVNSNGTLGIANVSAAGADVIFDLQGHRLSAPARGINIINGRKVLVK